MNRFTRTADPWCTRLPIPRFLRNTPFRTLRERMLFVSRMEPKIQVTVNLARNIRTNHTCVAAPAAVVLLNRWLGSSSVPIDIQHAKASDAPAKPAIQRVRISPMPAPRRDVTRESIVVRTLKNAGTMAMASSATGESPAVLIRLAGRAQRVEAQSRDASVRVVKRGGSGPAASGTTSPVAEWNGWGERHKRAPRFDELVLPIQPAQPAAVNVGQITDEVLKQLDRRLIATRERLGRT